MAVANLSECSSAGHCENDVGLVLNSTTALICYRVVGQQVVQQTVQHLDMLGCSGFVVHDVVH